MTDHKFYLSNKEDFYIIHIYRFPDDYDQNFPLNNECGR